MVDSPLITKSKEFALQIMRSTRKRLKCLILTRIKSWQRIIIGGLIAD